mgnify:CR=1 FL=1
MVQLLDDEFLTILDNALEQSQLKPEYSALYKGDFEEDNVCFMMTNDLIRQINYHLDSMATTNESPDGFYVGLRPATVRALLDHMAAHWNAKIERKGRRYPVLTKLVQKGRNKFQGRHLVHLPTTCS